MSHCPYRVRVDDKFVTCFLTYGECSGSHFSESARHCLKNASDGWCQMLKLLRRTEKLIFFLLVSITFDAMRRLHVTSWKANICQYFSTHALKFFSHPVLHNRLMLTHRIKLAGKIRAGGSKFERRCGQNALPPFGSGAQNASDTNTALSVHFCKH